MRQIRQGSSAAQLDGVSIDQPAPLRLMTRLASRAAKATAASHARTTRGAAIPPRPASNPATVAVASARRRGSSQRRSGAPSKAVAAPVGRKAPVRWSIA